MRATVSTGLCIACALAGCGPAAPDGPTAARTLATVQATGADVRPVVTIAGSAADYTVVKAVGGIVVTRQADGVATTYAAATQTVRFYDRHVSFDVDGLPGQVYRTYQAAFDRVPDMAGLGYWIRMAQSGVPMRDIAAGFIDSEEFADRYGSALSAKDFVAALYANILHRAPEQPGYDWWVAALGAGVERAAVLASFAASAENRAVVDPGIAGGFAFDYYRQPGDPILPQATSYANAKEAGLGQTAFPASAAGSASDGPLAWGAGDFEQTGRLGLFTATQNYRQWDQGYEEATGSVANLSDFAFWRAGADGKWSRVAGVKGCLHPRKGVVADFNRDGIPDVFVACTGYDGGTFPGERSKLWLSDGGKGFVLSDVLDVGYYHGAAAADVNGDGYPDLVVANIKRNPNVYFLINQKDGTFREDTGRIDGVANAGPYFSVELLDVDGDGRVDLVMGGHEQSGLAPTRILYGDANGRFGANGRADTIPTLPGRGIVLDFTLLREGGRRGLFVGRSADETSTMGFYGSRTLQWVALPTLASRVVLDEKNAWIPWWQPAVRDGATGVAPFYARVSYFFLPPAP